MAGNRAYVTSDVPLNGFVFVTDASGGPAEFSIRLVNRNWEYRRMRSELKSCTLHPLSGSPDKGTPCIAVISGEPHRGLVLSTRWEHRNSYNVCLVDIGCIEILPEKWLFEIPDEILAYHLFSTSVALADGEALSALPGLNEIFSQLILEHGSIVSEVVKEKANPQIINLFDTESQSIIGLVLGLYNKFFVSKWNAQSPAQPTIPIIEILDPPLKPSEKLFVMVSHQIGHFFGQLHSRPTSELSELSSDLRKFYEAIPQAQRLDAGSYRGHTAVVKWSKDGKNEEYYRCRILYETGNYARISLIDFGNDITVSRRNLFALVRTGRFCQPAFGIHCEISRKGGVPLKKEDWDAALIEKSVEVRTLRRRPDGPRFVAFTSAPLNHKIVELLFPPTTPAEVENLPAQISISPTPSRVAPAETKIGEDLKTRKLSPEQIDQLYYSRSRDSIKNLFLQHPAVAPVIPMVTSPREATSAGTDFLRRSAQSKTVTAPKTIGAQLVDSDTPSIRSVPVPTGTDSLSVAGRNMEQKIFAEIESSLKNDAAKTKDVATFLQKFKALKPSPDAKPVFPRPAVSDLCDPSIRMQTKDQEVHVSYWKSPTEFWVQLKVDEDIFKSIAEELIEHMKKAPLRVARPIIGQIYVIQHPTLGGYFRARVSAVAGDTVEACFVDYGYVLPIPILKMFSPSARLQAIPPLAACCRMKKQDWSVESKQEFVSITSNFGTVFRASFGPIIGKSVRQVEALLLLGKNIEDDISQKQTSELLKVTKLIYDIFCTETKSVVEVNGAFPRPAITDLRDPTLGLNSDGHDIYVSYVDSLSEFWIQLKADEQSIFKVGKELTQQCLKKANQPFAVDQLFAVKQPITGGIFRARVSSVNRATAKALFVDYGDSYLISTKNIFILPECIRLVPPLATRCSMKRQPNTALELQTNLNLAKENSKDVFRATFGSMDDDGVRRVHSLFKKPKNPVSVYLSYVKSSSEFWIQHVADEQLVNKICGDLTQELEKAKKPVVVGDLYAVEHPTSGGKFRARITSVNNSTVQAFFVDYGYSHQVSIGSIFELPECLRLLPPLATRCSMDRQLRPFRNEWALTVRLSIYFIGAKMRRDVFWATFGPLDDDGVRQVDYLSQKLSDDTSTLLGNKTLAEEAFPRPSITNLRDPSLKMAADGYDVYTSYVKSPSELWIQLKADENLIIKVGGELTQGLEKAKLPVIVEHLYAVEHPTFGGHFRARITSVSGGTAQAFFVDYGDVHPVSTESIFELPERLRLLPSLASRYRIKRKVWPLEAEAKFTSMTTSNLGEVFRATFGPMGDDAVSLFRNGTNIEDLIFSGLDEDSSMSVTVPVVEKAVPESRSAPDKVKEPLVKKNDPEWCSALGVVEPELVQEKATGYLQMRNSIALDDGSQPMHVVTTFTGESAPLTDLNLATLEAIPWDNVVIPVVVKQAGSILIDGHSTLFEMRPTTPVEKEQQPASILMEEACDAETPAPSELVPNKREVGSDPADGENAVRDREQLAVLVLIGVDEPFNPVAAAAAFPMPKASNPAGGSSLTQDRSLGTAIHELNDLLDSKSDVKTVAGCSLPTKDENEMADDALTQDSIDAPSDAEFYEQLVILPKESQLASDESRKEKPYQICSDLAEVFPPANTPA